MLRRDIRYLRPCNRLLSPSSVIFAQLIMGASETSHNCHYSLLVKAESDGMESHKASKTL